MRTYYEIEDEDPYLAGRDLLLRRCGRWAAANGLTLSPLLAGAIMDSRHFSADGRLGYWTPVQVGRALLEWLPEKVTAPETELMPGPDSLRTLLRYLGAHGLRDPRGATALWERAFETLFDPDLASAVCPPNWLDEPPGPVALLYDLVVPDVLATIYSMEHPVPTVRIAESVWDLVQTRFDVTWLSPLGLAAERGRMEDDLDHIFDAFEALGAIASVDDVADGVFSSDLGEEHGMPDDADRPFAGERAAALRQRLAVPGRLVSFAPLGTRAMRQRLLAEGREAGLVGELADATAAELLGTIAEHYTPDTGAAEIAIWRAAHDGSIEPLLQAARECPFIIRRIAMMNVLSHALPEWDELAMRLSRDPELWPIVLLMRKDELDPERISPEDALMIMTGSVLELLELGGPEAVLTSLGSLPHAQRNDIIAEVSGSGFPASETLEDFVSLVARPARPALSPPDGRPRLRVIRNDQHRPARKKERRR